MMALQQCLPSGTCAGFMFGQRKQAIYRFVLILPIAFQVGSQPLDVVGQTVGGFLHMRRIPQEARA
jgi:hypothetical protein